MTDTGARQRLTIGFVGLGHMGWPMARNLHHVGLRLIVRDPVTQERFAAEHPGVTVADSPAAFSAAQVIVTMLPNGAVVQDALLHWDGGIGPALQAGTLLVDMSSSDPSDTLRLAAELERFGVRVVDAPVSGGVPRAITGELSIMVGGAPDAIAKAQDVLRVLGDPARQFVTGGLGTGHAMKALNNFVAAATHCATAEALVAGKRFGLDPQKMIDIINASTGQSFVSGTFDAQVLTGRYGTGFAVGLLAKDVHIAASVAAAAGVDAPVVALVDERWAKAAGELGPAADHTTAHQAWWDEPLS